MINTDKYEGHTPAPWEYFYAKNCDDWILKTPLYIHSGKGVRMKKDSVDAQLIADAPLLLEEVKRLTEFRDKVLAAFIEMPRNSRSLTYLLNDEGYLKHYSREDYLKGLHPHSLGLYELHEEWKEKAQQYLGEEEE